MHDVVAVDFHEAVAHAHGLAQQLQARLVHVVQVRQIHLGKVVVAADDHKAALVLAERDAESAGRRLHHDMLAPELIHACKIHLC